MAFEHNILEDKKEGFSFYAIRIKDKKFVTLRKAHYFRDGKSLCGKYLLPDNIPLLKGGLYESEICEKCLKKLKKQVVSL